MPHTNLWRLLSTHVDRTPDKVLLRYGNHEEKYGEFYAESLRAAAAFQAAGVRPGDSVCLMLANSPDYLHTWFGLEFLGAVKIPLNVHLKGEGLAYIISHAQARVLLVEVDLLERIMEIKASLPDLEQILVRGDRTTANGEARWSDLLAQAHQQPRGTDVASDAIAAILYTSGTTGPPKGAGLSHAAYLNSARLFAQEMVGLRPEDVLYTCLPLFHINAQAHTVLPAILCNATMALGDRFSASGFWDDVRASRATIFNSLAAMIPILCKQPPTPRDRDHRARLTACAATPRDSWLEFEGRFGVHIVEGYGLTETAGFCVANPLAWARLGSIGKPMRSVDVRVLDENDRPVAPGQLGEIAIRERAPHVLMEGYYRMPAETAHAMKGGWFHSGDQGYADADGYLYFVDRIKQSIRRRGENISSWEVEKVVNAHPLVLESAAVGVPSELGEEDVKICVVPRPGVELEPPTIIAWCEDRMAYFMVPRYVDLRTSLPKTATERVEKYKLKHEGTRGAWDREAAGYRLKRS